MIKNFALLCILVHMIGLNAAEAKKTPVKVVKSHEQCTHEAHVARTLLRIARQAPIQHPIFALIMERDANAKAAQVQGAPIKSTVRPGQAPAQRGGARKKLF